MRLIAWGKSDTGQQRQHNEDSLLIEERLGLFAVADGMGGHLGGETASRLALDVLRRLVTRAAGDLARAAAELADRREEAQWSWSEVTPVQAPGRDRGWRERMGRAPTAPLGVPILDPPATAVMRAAAQEAGVEIFGAASEDSRLHGMGTTLTAMLYHADEMHMVHAGDSRAYRLRDDCLERLTQDHSWIAEQVRRGNMSESEARASNLRHVITRSVGYEREVELDAARVSVRVGDCFLLCSDGMSNYIDDPEIERLLRVTWHRRVPQLFVDIANQRGGDDNITVILIQAANDAGAR
ncbi:MAG TPA: protein phosphatase 2C domain-containing protein [Haliangium sp.]|nr:protein phosphatase 2C domain-containing protein [Haliangium sp.]